MRLKVVDATDKRSDGIDDSSIYGSVALWSSSGSVFCLLSSELALAADTVLEMVRDAAVAVGEEERGENASRADVLLLAFVSSWLADSKEACDSSLLSVVLEVDWAGAGSASCDSSCSSTDVSAGFGDGDLVFFFEGESKRKVSSTPLVDVGMGLSGAVKLDSISWRCCRTASSAWESECFPGSILGLSK
jgi:hypothetical protein